MKKFRIDFDKNSKIKYYTKCFFALFFPSFFKKDIKNLYEHLSESQKHHIQKRVSYYNQVAYNFQLDSKAKTIDEFKKYESKKTYYFDTLKYMSYFDETRKFTYIFGDVKTVPEIPSVVKSRPISHNNQNSVLLKLNKIRHFIYVHDTLNFRDKKDMLVWRGQVFKEHRKAFLKKYFHSPYCDVGQTNKQKTSHDEWKKKRLSLREQLEYKFILSIEGNDVASNLKWAMSSNSLVLMKKPKYETWFMEGRLIENFHYVLLQDDYSDLIEKIEYYLEQFKNDDIEDIISYKVLEQYFKYAQ
jgi:hypothetical protein